MPHTIGLTGDRQKFGMRLFELRTRRNLTQRQLTELMNASGPSVVGHWESGRQIPSLIMAVRLAKALNISLDELTAGIEW